MLGEEEGIRKNSQSLFTGYVCCFSVVVAASDLSQTGYQHTPKWKTLTDIGLQVACTNSFKGLIGVLPTTQFADAWLASTLFHSPLLYFPGGKPHTLVPGRQPLSFEHPSSVENWQDDTKLVWFFFFSCNAIGNATFPLWMCDHLHHWSLLFILPPCLFSPSSVRLWGRGQAYLPWEMPLWERDPAFPFCRQPWSLCVILLEIPSLGFGDEKASLSRPLASPGSHPQFLWIYHFSQFFNTMGRAFSRDDASHLDKPGAGPGPCGILERGYVTHAILGLGSLLPIWGHRECPPNCLLNFT